MCPAGNTDNEEIPRGTHRYLALCGIAAPLVLLAGVVVAGLSWEGYSHRTQVISDLGGTLAPYPVIQNVTFLVVGLSVTAFAFGLSRSMAAAGGGGAGPGLIGALGISWAVMPLFPCSSVGCQGGTATEVVHLLIINSGLLAFVVGTFLFSRRIREHPGWRPRARYTAVTAIATLVTLLATYAAVGAPDDLSLGAVQRINGIIVFGWIGLAGVHLWNLSG